MSTRTISTEIVENYLSYSTTLPLMDFSRRQLLGLGGGLAAMASLAACQASPTATSTSSGQGPTISQWYHEYGEDGVKEAVTRFAAEYPNATVNVVWRTGDYEKAVAAALLTDDVPDVFEYGNGPTLDMIKAGQVVDLTDVVSDAQSEFTERVLQRVTYDGKIWAIPQTVDMQLLYYRPSVLAAAGVQPPETFDDLVRVSEAVSTSSMGGFFAGNDGGIGVLGLNLLWASGLSQFNEDRSDVQFGDAAFVDAVTKYRDFYHSGHLVKSASDDWYSSAPFVNEEAAMQWGGLWSLPEITEAFGDDVAVLPFPAVGAQGRTVVPFGAYGSVVAAKGKSIDAAKSFARWLWIEQVDKQVEFSNAFGTHIPAKPELFSRADKIATGPGADAARYVTDMGHVTDLFWTDAMSQAFNGSLSNAIIKKSDVKTEIDAAVVTARAELARIR